MFRYTYVVYICQVLWVFCTTRFAYSKHQMKQFPRKGKRMHSYRLPESAKTSTELAFLSRQQGSVQINCLWQQNNLQMETNAQARFQGAPAAPPLLPVLAATGGKPSTGGGGWQAGGTQTCCRHPAAEEQSRERRLCQLSAFCRAGRAHLLHPTPPRVSAISQYSFAPEEHLTDNSVTFAYTQGSYFSVDSQGYDFCTVSLYNPPSILNPENLP